MPYSSEPHESLIRALLIEDNPSDAYLLQESLDASVGLVEIEWVEDLAAGLERLNSEQFDIVLLDLSLPDSISLDSLQKILQPFPRMPIVILTGLDDGEVAIEAVKRGAQDFLVKGKPSGESIYRCMRYAIERQLSQDLIRQSAVDANEARANLQLALATSQLGIFYWDLLTKQITWDQRVSDLFGIDASVGNIESMTGLIPAEDLKTLEMALTKCLEPGERQESEVQFRAIWSDGSTHYLSSRARAIFNDEGSPVRLTGVVTDNTRQVEEQRSKRRLALLEQREEFIAMLAHDLRTPIFGSQRLIDLMIQGALGEISPAHSSVLSKISDSNQGILHSINNVLDVYRLEANPTTPLLRTHDINAIISACINQLEPIAKGCEIKLNWTPEVPLHPVNVDEVSMSRILSNLVSNALKFTPAGGQVEVSVKEREGKSVLVVTDNGIGMEKAVADKVFDRFYQSSRQYRGKGLGLGLYLCRQLIGAMGGSISCKSTPGRGTTFEVTMVQAPGVSVKRRSVLVVDDNRLNQLVLQASLQNMSLEADTVSSGKEALLAVKQKHYHAIFVDYMMPVMDGLSTSKALRDAGVGAPLFCYSAIDPLESMHLEDSSFDDFLQKPIENAKLKRLMTRWLPRCDMVAPYHKHREAPSCRAVI
ncbi:MAG: response regulator [Candidatus Melainabacteria bacterium]|nr:response regulator [Candidatus Melainabacteria bacterium]